MPAANRASREDADAVELSVRSRHARFHAAVLRDLVELCDADGAVRAQAQYRLRADVPFLVEALADVLGEPKHEEARSRKKHE